MWRHHFTGSTASCPLTRAADPIDVDLVDMASCPAELRARIESDGIEA